MTDAEVPGRAPSVCAQCGTQIAPALLACPSCRLLVYAEELKRLAATADGAEQAGDPSAALAAWPAGAKHGSGLGKGAAGVGALGALLFKFKFALMFVLTKAKLLLFGLTKAGTFFSMLLSASLYWTMWGWKFAVGVVLSIYIHEMGHVQALQRYGIKATAPMFIPGFGDVIRLKQYPANAREDARVGLAGPLWGLGAYLSAYIVYSATGIGGWCAIAHFTGWVDLF